MDKAVGQFRLQLNGVLGVFKGYGYDVYIPEVIDQIEELALQLHNRLDGEDVAIITNYNRTGLSQNYR